MVTSRFENLENAPVAAQPSYPQWRFDRAFMLVSAGALIGEYMQTLMQFPPRQRPDSFTVGDVMEKLMAHKKAVESASGVGAK